MSRRRADLMARYEEIALDLADQVARGEIRVGERLVGRSGLAGRYKVSPETVRRAVALLHARGIVKTVPGVGILVQSRDLAAHYAQESERAQALLRLENEVRELLEERRILDDKLDRAIGRMVRATVGALGTMRHVDEIRVAEEASCVGQTLAAAGLRERTGATVIGLARDGEEIFSPLPTQEIRAGDMLIVVGSDTAKDLLREIVEGRAGTWSPTAH